MKIKVFFALLFIGVILPSFAYDIFQKKVSAKYVSDNIYAFESAKCTFSQNKFMKKSEVSLISGGDFEFIKDKGVIFKTTYPIQSDAYYTSDSNKNAASIIKSVANKNYAYLDKNFDLFYLSENNESWILALKPKKGTKIEDDLISIQIFGKNLQNTGSISKMVIDTKNIKNEIKFDGCR